MLWKVINPACDPQLEGCSGWNEVNVELLNE